MRNIVLHGSLAKKYGSSFQLSVKTAGEAIRALSANFPGFMNDIREGAWHVVRGNDPDTGISLDEAQLTDFRLGQGDLHIVPFVAGSKRGGLLKVILGVVLIGAAFVLTAGAGLGAAIGAQGTLLGGITGTQVALFGAAIALAGVSSLLAPEEKAEDTEKQNSSRCPDRAIPTSRATRFRLSMAKSSRAACCCPVASISNVFRWAHNADVSLFNCPRNQ